MYQIIKGHKASTNEGAVIEFSPTSMRSPKPNLNREVKNNAHRQ